MDLTCPSPGHFFSADGGACRWTGFFDPAQDVADTQFQAILLEQLQEVVFIAAALDCSTITTAWQIPRNLGDGRPMPKSLCSDQHPQEGLPSLHMKDQVRVFQDSLACDFILDELQQLQDRGRSSLRENPDRRLHWERAQEKRMWQTGAWWETKYDACVFVRARCKSQRLRHSVEEISQWPDLRCRYSHDPDEWTPYLQDGRRVYPSHEEAEYTASLAVAIAASVSCSACGQSQTWPWVDTAGRREHWLMLRPEVLRSSSTGGGPA